MTHAESPDPVMAYLAAQGVETTVCYLGETEFELGRNAQLGRLHLTYRVEGHTLIICEIGSSGGHPGIASAVRQLIALIRRITADSPQIDSVRGVLPDTGFSETLRMQQRLQRIYTREGARIVEGSGGDLVIEFLTASTP